jgi:hypothetical protein
MGYNSDGRPLLLYSLTAVAGGIIITLVGDSYVLQLLHLNEINMRFYPAMTAFTDQYSLPNIFFDIGQL